MEFAWDPEKEAENIAQRGLPFTLATAIFLDPLAIDIPDDRFDYGEERHIVIGAIEGQIFVVVYADRGDVRRIISFRRANSRERKRYCSV